MTDKLVEYKRADASPPERYRLWPLYGAGFENLGRDGQMIEVSMPEYGPDELLVRHDACGICFSDIKVIEKMFGWTDSRDRTRKLAAALTRPLKPVEVSRDAAPCQEEVITDDLDVNKWEIGRAHV